MLFWSIRFYYFLVSFSAVYKRKRDDDSGDREDEIYYRKYIDYELWCGVKK
jgi:hypothetical protein